jgi:hypothetical protein
VAGTWLVFAALLLLTLLSYLAGIYLLWMPRQCAALCEVFAASGNFPSPIPRSVRAAVIEIRLVGSFFLVIALLLIHAMLTPRWVRLLLVPADIPNPYWLVFPALVAILAGYTVVSECAPYVSGMLDYWMDHPLVPRRLIPAFPWALRLVGAALLLFGAGVFWTWLCAAIG